MSEEYNKTSSKNPNTQVLGMAIGLVLGGLVGILLDNIAIFSGGGMILGFAIGTAMHSRD
jgi:F0F1-type ATP synthase assembly protein I